MVVIEIQISLQKNGVRQTFIQFSGGPGGPGGPGGDGILVQHS